MRVFYFDDDKSEYSCMTSGGLSIHTNTQSAFTAPVGR